MDSYPVSDALKDLLDRKGMRGATVGAVAMRGNKGPGAATDRARRQVARHEGGDMHGGGIRLVWSQEAATAIRKSVRTAAPFRMIEGGLR